MISRQIVAIFPKNKNLEKTLKSETSKKKLRKRPLQGVETKTARTAGVGSRPTPSFSTVRGIHHHCHGYSAGLIPFKINCQFSFGCPRHLTGFEFSHELDLGRVIRKTSAGQRRRLHYLETYGAPVCFLNATSISED